MKPWNRLLIMMSKTSSWCRHTACVYQETLQIQNIHILQACIYFYIYIYTGVCMYTRADMHKQRIYKCIGMYIADISYVKMYRLTHAHYTISCLLDIFTQLFP